MIKRQISEVGTSPPRRTFGVFGICDGVICNQYFWNGLAIGKIEALTILISVTDSVFLYTSCQLCSPVCEQMPHFDLFSFLLPSL